MISVIPYPHASATPTHNPAKLMYEALPPELAVDVRPWRGRSRMIAEANIAPPSIAIHVRNLQGGEQPGLPAALSDTGMPYLVPDWVWVVESAPSTDPIALLTSPPASPFALIVTSFAHGWLVLWRILTVSPLPSTVPLSWFLEALPQVFEQARTRGCVGFMTLLADNRPQEAKMARILASLPGCSLLPFHGSMGVGPLTTAADKGGEK